MYREQDRENQMTSTDSTLTRKMLKPPLKRHCLICKKIYAAYECKISNLNQKKNLKTKGDQAVVVQLLLLLYAVFYKCITQDTSLYF